MTNSDLSATVTERADGNRRSNYLWVVVAWLMVLASGLVLRYGTAVMDKEIIRDNYLHMLTVENIIEQGWSVETAIDYQEVKGPAFFWPYAAAGQVLGNDIQTMRLVSMLFYVFGAWPVLLIAVRCGIRRWGLIAVGLFWILLP